MLDESVHKPGHFHGAVFGNNNTAGIVALSIDLLKAPDLSIPMLAFNTGLALTKKRKDIIGVTHLFSSPAAVQVLHKALEEKTLSFTILLTDVVHEEALNLGAIYQSLALQELFHLLVVGLGADLHIGAEFPICALRTTEQPRTASDLAENVVFVLSWLPVGDTMLGCAFDTASNYLVDVDVHHLAVLLVCVLMDLQSDGGHVEGLTLHPTHALLFMTDIA
jgi:hypothetical protein